MTSRLSPTIFALLLLLPATLAAQSARPGMGSIPYRNAQNQVAGVTFRVWAPNATSVAVAGEFNNWAATALTRESGTGRWSADLPAARPGQRYKYLLNGTLWKRDPRARLATSTNPDGESVIYDPAAFSWGSTPQPLPAVQDLVMYELHAGTFFDPNPSDGRPATLDEAIRRLDYLKNLGVNCLALMPVAEFPGFHSWGYNPAEIFAVEASYGGPDALKRFVKAAHERGMAVKLDVVHNHWGNGTDTGDLDLWRFDGSFAAGRATRDSGGIYFYQQPFKSRTPWGPRPDYSAPEVRSFIQDNIRMWLEEYRVGGLRWDSPRNMLGFSSTSGFDPDTDIPEARTLLESIHGMIQTSFPGRFSVSEDVFMAGNFDGHWQAGFYNDIAGGLKSSNPDMGQIAWRLGAIEPPGWRVIFTDNHDKSGDLNQGSEGGRLATDFDPVNPQSLLSRKKAALAAVFTLTAPGVPMVWMGQEMHQQGNFRAEEGLDWALASRNHRMVTLWRDLIRLRRNLDGTSNGLRGGEIQVLHVEPTNKVVAYGRRTSAGAGDDVFVVLNLSPVAYTDYWLTFPATGTWRVQFHSDWRRYGSDFGGGTTSSATTAGDARAPISLPPWSAIIYSRATPPARDTLLGDDNGNGLPDGWEIIHNVASATADPDGDGLTNLQEFQRGRDPNQPDFQTVAGNFNSWSSTAANMRWSAASNRWEFVSRFPATGQLEFKFVIDGTWLGDNPSPTGVASATGGNIRRNVTTAAVWRLTYDETTGAYTAEALPWQDADNDGLHDQWEAFHGQGTPTANPDGDTFTNLQEFLRASHPLRPEHPDMTAAGTFNGWNLAARNMRHTGHGRWELSLHVRAAAGPQSWKFLTGGSWDPGTNWGQPLSPGGPAVQQGDNFTTNFAAAGWYHFTFQEDSLAWSAGPVPGEDADGDGLPDAWERFYGLNAGVPDATGDPDADGISNLDEYRRGSLPDTADHYGRVAVVGDFNGWNTAVNNMTFNLGTYLWEFNQRFNAGATINFKFVANGHQTGWTLNWGDNLPADTVADQNSGDNIRLVVPATGNYRITLDELTRVYRITQETNTAPVLSPSTALGAVEDQPFHVLLGTLDAENDPVTVTATSLPSWMSITYGTNGTFSLSGTPAAAHIGTTSLAFNLSDGKTNVQRLLGLTVVTHLANWATSAGLSGTNAAPGADPDRDGWPNFHEYAFGGRPDLNDAASLAPQTSVVGGRLRISFVRRSGIRSLSTTVQRSTQLGGAWGTNNVVQVGPASTNGLPAGLERLTFESTVPVQNELRQFLRVRAVQTP